ncbi:MAG: glycosyltransferase, partial [Deltaproteobacteria bacterium]|nr:glycosyltransferase [Deltaproteobacteria bacterium]
PYIFDDYIFQWTGPARRIAARFELSAMRAARAVIVPNEFARDEYARRCGAPGVIVRNPCLLPDLADLDGKKRVFEPGEAHIVYTGSVYHAQADAFRNLIAAASRLGHARVRLHIYTAQSDADLESQGIAGPMVERHPLVPQSEVASILRQADILFLPLAFRSPIPEVIRTSAPGKVGEYLAVGRPILLHAPADSFLSWYFRTNKCGVVADRENPEDLAASIERLRTDRALRDSVSSAARIAAKRDFDLGKIRKTFEALLEEILAGSGGEAPGNE